MQHQRAGFELEQQVLGSALRVQDALAGYQIRQVALHAPPQSGLMDGKREDLVAHGVGLDTPARGFDFWELGHGGKGYNVASGGYRGYSWWGRVGPTTSIYARRLSRGSSVRQRVSPLRRIVREPQKQKRPGVTGAFFCQIELRPAAPLGARACGFT
jgi:hypothetical protein